MREEGSHKANSVSCSWDEPLPHILRNVDQFARSELVCADVSPTDANSIVRRRGGRAPLVALFIQGAPKRAGKAIFLDSLTREILQSEHTCASGNSKRRETLTGWFWPCNSIEQCSQPVLTGTKPVFADVRTDPSTSRNAFSFSF